MTKQTLTQSRLKELLRYNQYTGRFYRLSISSNCISTGMIKTIPNKKGYLRIMVDGIRYFAHRIAYLYMTGGFPENQIDHANHIRSDNRWLNISDATPLENARNASIRKDNKSGISGVAWRKSNKRWWARISVDGKRKYLGYFNNLFDAACAKRSAENKYGYHNNHGDFLPSQKLEPPKASTAM